MRKIFLWIALCIAHFANAQKFTITESRAEYVKEIDSLKHVGDKFVDKIELALKQNYPAAISDSATTFKISEDRDGKIRLTYETVIQFTDSASAMNHVKHKGALSEGFTKKAAGASAQKRCLDQFDVAVTEFAKAHGKRILISYPQVKTGVVDGTCYALSEAFIASFGKPD